MSQDSSPPAALKELVIIRNYAPDGQFSMRLYADLVASVMREKGVPVRFLAPPVIFGKWTDTTHRGLGKWLGYLDKYILFPLILRQVARTVPKGTVFHICDHSNSMYAAPLRGHPVVLTCHDLLAVRGALGDAAAFCPSSRTGVILQRWILKHLKTVPATASVSEYTRQDLLQLAGREDTALTCTIHSPNNCPFLPLDEEVVSAIFQKESLWIKGPYLLHVGSSLPRKNRTVIFHILAQLQEHWPEMQAVFVGSDFSASEQAQLALAGVESCVTVLGRVSHDLLNALYANAHALVFPSWAEGFGWPILEAQTVGCPVLCSNCTSIPEVAGEGAWLFAPKDAASMAGAVIKLRDSSIRQNLIEAGFQNTRRFTIQTFTDSYLSLYLRVLAAFENDHPF